MYSGASSGSYSLLTNNDCYATSASSIVSSTATTPLIYNTSNFDNLIAQQQSSSAGSSSNPNASYDLLGATTAASILDYSGLYHHQNYGQKLTSQSSAATSNLLNQVSSSGGVINVGMSPSPNTSCSSSSTAMLPSQQQQPNSSSTANSNYFDQQSLDEQRKTIDDQLKQLDGQLLSKVSELTLIQQQHIQLQEQQNRNLKSKNALLLSTTPRTGSPILNHCSSKSESRSSSLSLCNTRSSSKKAILTNSNGNASKTNSLQALPTTKINVVASPASSEDSQSDKEVFY